jgi:predicted MPP superfamily phosphohydrolase
VLGGDYVGGKRKGADIFYPAAAHLYAPLGVYAIAGNHDYWENKSELADLIEGAGMTFLRNSSARLEVNGAGLWLAAVDDLDAGKPHLEKAYEEVDPDEFLIYLSHNPDFFEQGLTVMREDPNNNAPVKDSANAEVVVPDLALAGHTHGGQVTPFGILLDAPTSYGYRYLTGWRTEDKVPILVSNGVGVSVAPLRLGAPAQMHLFTLKRGKAKITTTTVKNVKL